MRITDRSRCPHCNIPIAWYDNIPIISWIILGGKCRQCTQPISYLYPSIELLTALVMTAAYIRIPLLYFPAYFIFFSALIVTIRSDIECMLISRFVTIFLIPIGIACSIIGFLPISLSESITSTISGYLLLWFIAIIFSYMTGKEGIGQGDIDLLAFIGSFTGLIGLWATLLIASITGTIFGLIYMLITRTGRSTKIPFGPFLAAGAIIFVLFQELFIQLL